MFKKTAEGTVNFLTKKDLLESFINNNYVKRQYSTTLNFQKAVKNHLLAVKTYGGSQYFAPSPIKSAFTWQYTKEGHTYWYELSTELYNEIYN